MTDSVAEVVYTILQAYTWVNYIHPITSGNPPPMLVTGKNSIRKFKEEYVEITDIREEPEFTFNGVQIFSNDDCTLRITAITSVQRELIFADIKLAFQNSSIDITFKNVRTRPTLKRYERIISVRVTG